MGLSTTKEIKKKAKPAQSKNGTAGTGSPEKIYESDSHLDDKELLRILLQVRNGNFTVRMPIGEVGVKGSSYDTLNDIIRLNEEMMREFNRAGNTIGKQGKLTQRIAVPNAKGSWATGVDSLNVLISDLVHPTIEIAHVISSVAKGNLSQNMPLEIDGRTCRGEFSRIAPEGEDMGKTLNLFSM